MNFIIKMLRIVTALLFLLLPVHSLVDVRKEIHTPNDTLHPDTILLDEFFIDCEPFNLAVFGTFRLSWSDQKGNI